MGTCFHKYKYTTLTLLFAASIVWKDGSRLASKWGWVTNNMWFIIRPLRTPGKEGISVCVCVRVSNSLRRFFIFDLKVTLILPSQCAVYSHRVARSCSGSVPNTRTHSRPSAAEVMAVCSDWPASSTWTNTGISPNTNSQHSSTTIGHSSEISNIANFNNKM